MKSITVLILVFLSLISIAQDKIVKKSGDIIDCTITEVGSDEIKYFFKDRPEVIFVVDNATVINIEFSNGEIIKMESRGLNNPEYYMDQNKRAAKINFLSPLMGSTEFVYEQSIKPGKTWEVALGAIGIGLDPQDLNPAGVFVKYAYKFIRTPDFYMQRMQYSHILKGAYFAPEFAIRYMEYDGYDYNNYDPWNSPTKRENDFAVALTLKFGKQWVFDNSFLVDLFWGIGYGYSDNTNEALNYGFTAGNKDLPIAFTGGLRVGWTF